MNLIVNGQAFRIDEVRQQAAVHLVSINSDEVTVEVLTQIGRDPFELLVAVENRVFRLVVQRDRENGTPIMLNGRRFHTSFAGTEDSGSARKVQDAEGSFIITAPMSGRIVSLRVSVGSVAEEGKSLVILEAMKMENEIAAPRRGIVREVYVQAGALVKAGDKLVLVE